ncbi:uncharacterized protein EMH_0048960 [Eimeria mitis]|uniref:Uncharacterized protein n=1 Tax=Eimeria mitis TaxID=44415 RepID=U6K0S3_9EIME|nr:uncharacterized protein EMH_0048960 [Eimeria mitis]CDJ29353.1 hypothetical protein EMH_0048960 [Eimeria mitis]
MGQQKGGGAADLAKGALLQCVEAATLGMPFETPERGHSGGVQSHLGLSRGRGVLARHHRQDDRERVKGRGFVV